MWGLVSLVVAIWFLVSIPIALLLGAMARKNDRADLLQQNVRHSDGSQISRKEAEGLAKIFELQPRGWN